MNDDDNYEVIDGKRTKIVRDGGRVVTKMLAMDEQTVTPRRPMRDAALHRPGYRTGQMLQQHTADAATDATLVAARDAKEAAYMDYQRDLILAHKPAAERNEIMSQLADARTRKAMAAYARGLEEKDPDVDEDEDEEDRDEDEEENGEEENGEEENGEEDKRQEERPQVATGCPSQAQRVGRGRGRRSWSR